MWSQDLAYLLDVLSEFPVRVERIACGIVYTTCFHKIPLRGFLAAPADGKHEFIKRCLES